MIEKECRDYIQDIMDCIKDAAAFIAGMTFDSFITDRKTINAVIRSIEVIGEAAKNVPETLRKKYPAIPWKKMAGMRDKLIHEYSGVDLEMVWKTTIEDLPSIKPIISKVLKDL